MFFFEFCRVREPAERIAERADRKVDGDITLGIRIVVAKDALALLPDLNAEAHKIALAAVDPPALELGLKQDIAGIEIAQSNAPGLRRFRKNNAAAIIEIKLDSMRRL